MPKQIDQEMLSKLRELNKAGKYDELVQYICEQNTKQQLDAYADNTISDICNQFYDEISAHFDDKSKAKATPHKDCGTDTQSDFSSDCPNLPQEY